MVDNFTIENKKSQVVMDKNGLYWYQFNETSGNAVDSKGSAYTGTLSSATRVTGWDGKGSAINFNGNSLITFNNSLMTYGEKTISLRFKTLSNSNMFLFENYATPTVNQTGYNMVINQGKVIMRRITSSGGDLVTAFSLESTQTYNDDQWHKAMFTWSGSSNQVPKLYIDDQLVDSKSTTVSETSKNFATQNMTLGGSKMSAFRRYFTGQIDDFQVYNKVLTPEDFTLNQSFIYHNNEYKKYLLQDEFSYSDSLMPVMTSNNTPSGVARANSEYSVDRSVYRLFDGQIGTSDWVTASNILTGWVSYEFATPQEVNNYKLVGVVSNDNVLKRNPRDWTLEGSNDGVIWEVLDTQKNISWSTSDYIKNFNIRNKKTYLTYRLNITKNNGGTDNLSFDTWSMHSILNTVPRGFYDVSNTLPTQQQFIEQGMDALSPLLDRKVTELTPKQMHDKTEILLGEDGKVFAKNVDLKKYFDIRSIKVEVK